MSAQRYPLIGGPQDGARIEGRNIPDVVYVQRQWQGDGFATFGHERSKRFPCRYDRWEYTYRYVPLPS